MTHETRRIRVGRPGCCGTTRVRGSPGRPDYPWGKCPRGLRSRARRSRQLGDDGAGPRARAQGAASRSRTGAGASSEVCWDTGASTARSRADPPQSCISSQPSARDRRSSSTFSEREESDVSSTDEAKGRVKEAVGDLTDDKDMKREGKVDKASGKAKDAVDKAGDKAKDAVGRNDKDDD